ncbi:unnamed protein product [Echinostoma caproni]|uniref:STAR_dimer domain-containing protein n=1 Tax=Echinostoma caproni TaxID=27848 RepID=A0A183AJD3_9TREM|nr:unnamed protein product [Echinostoma caproni]
MTSNTENNKLETMLVHKATPEYLQDLLKDKKQLQNFPNIFLHLEIILEKEITRVREKLFHLNESYKKTENELPEPTGTITTLQEKVFVPVKENPNEDMNRGKPNWEHLDEDLHVLVSVEDFENRAAIKLRRATETIRAFLEQGVRTPNGEDELKRRQLMELAIINGTYRAETQPTAHTDNHTVRPTSDLIHANSVDSSTDGWGCTSPNDCGFMVELCLNPGSGDLRLSTSNGSVAHKDRQQAQAAHQVQQHQQLVLQHQSLTVLNNQAVAAAAAAQLLQSSPYHTSPLLGRLPAQATGGANLANYIPSSVLPNVLCPLSNSPSLPMGPGVNLSGQVGLGLSLPQLPGSSASVAVPGLGFPMGQTNSVSPNLISCTPGPTQDQLNAMAALLTSGAASSVASNVHLSNGKLSLQGTGKTNQLYPMTSLASPLVEAVNILDYNTATGGTAQDHVAGG